MSHRLTVLLAMVALVAITNAQKDLTILVNDYDNCIVPTCVSGNKCGTTVTGTPLTALYWSTSKGYFEGAIVTRTQGMTAFGFNKSPNPSPSKMYLADAIIGYTDTSGNHFVKDYYLSVDDISGVNPDTTDNLFNTSLVFAPNSNNTVVKFARQFNTGDNDDTLLTNQTQLFIFSAGSTQGVAFHRLGWGYFQTNPFIPRTTCPVDANNLECGGASRGTCVKGCCICVTGLDGRVCETNVTVPPPPAPPRSTLTAEIIPSEYQFKREFNGDFTFYWKIYFDAYLGGEVLYAAIDCACDGWVAFGPSTDLKMVGGDIIAGWIEDDGSVTIDDYYITSKQGGCPGVCKDTSQSGKNNIIDYNGQSVTVDGTKRTQLKWLRALSTNDTEADISIKDGTMKAIWGYHPSNKYISQHNGNTRGTLNINFYTGKVSAGIDLRVVHGIMMFIAWSIFMPVTSFVARFMKKYQWWFNFHRITNFIMMAAVIAAFGVAIAMTSDHFTTPHAIIGLIVLIIAVFQPIIGILADKFYNKDRLEPPWFPDKIHWIVGWVGLGLAMLNVLLGLILYGDAYSLVVAYAIYFAVVIGFLIAFIIYKAITGSSGTHYM